MHITSDGDYASYKICLACERNEKSHPSRRVKQHTAVDIRFCRKERRGGLRGEYCVPKQQAS